MKDIDDIDTSMVDVAAVFLGFMALVGDIDRTALAFNLSPRVVTHLAQKFGWNDKIKQTSLLSKQGAPGSWEICQNRAISWVQGHMLRSVLQRIIENIHNMSREEIVRTVIVQKGGGVIFSASFYSDLAAAVEKCHSLCYAAIGDSSGDRSRSEKGAISEEMSVTALHSAISTALNNPLGAGAERVLLEKETDRIVRASVPPRPKEDQ